MMKNRLALKETKILEGSTKQKLLKQRNTKLVDREQPYPIFDLTKCDGETLDKFKIAEWYGYAPYIPLQITTANLVGIVHHEVTTISPYSVPENNIFYCQNNANTYQYY